MMRAWLDTIRAFNITFRNIGRKRVTEPLPWKAKRQHPERYRATFALVHDEHGEPACIACGACEAICPSKVITVTSGEKRVSPVTGKKRAYIENFVLEQNACMFCELCVQVCPTDAIRMLKTYHTPGYSREDQVLTMEKLYKNAELDEFSWGRGSRLREMQDPNRKTPKEDS